MEQYADVVLDLEGNAIQGASVEVWAGSGNAQVDYKTPATVYDFNGHILPNSTIATGPLGDFAFSVPNGKYVIRVTVRGTIYKTIGPLTFYDPDDDQQKITKADLSMPNGAALIGAGNRTVSDVLSDYISVKNQGAKGDGSTDDTFAIQTAIDGLAPGGELFFPRGKYVISSDIRLTKPVLIRGVGPGSYINDLGSYIVQKTPSKNAFTLVAAAANYAFGQFGITDVHFKDIAIIGASSGNRSLAAIGVDTSVNGGDFHIRGNSFTNVRQRYFKKAYSLVGIAYLNNWFGGGVSDCDIGAFFARGTSSDVGGQNRFFGWTAVACSDVCISYFEDTSGGSIGLNGTTLSESGTGFRTNKDVSLYSAPDCEYEANSVAGIHIKIAGNNPNTSAPKTISGKFLTNACDIWLEKTTTAYADGGFYWPMKIDDAYLGSASSLKITVPSGHFGIDSSAFLIGRNVAGPNNGVVNPTQISTNFYGIDERKGRFTKRYQFNAATVSGAVLDSLPVGLVVVSVRAYLTANSASFTALKIGDQQNDTRYLTIDGSGQALNTWINWTPTLPQIVVSGSNNRLRIIGTAGINGSAGVIEVDGYIQ